MAMMVRPAIAPMTMPAIAPPESPPPGPEAEGVAEALVLAVAEAAVFEEEVLEDAVAGIDVDGVLVLSGAPEMVDIAARYEDMEPIAVSEASGTGVFSCVSVSSLPGAGA